MLLAQKCNFSPISVLWSHCLGIAWIRNLKWRPSLYFLCRSSEKKKKKKSLGHVWLMCFPWMQKGKKGPLFFFFFWRFCFLVDTYPWGKMKKKKRNSPIFPKFAESVSNQGRRWKAFCIRAQVFSWMLHKYVPLVSFMLSFFFFWLISATSFLMLEHPEDVIAFVLYVSQLRFALNNKPHNQQMFIVYRLMISIISLMYNLHEFFLESETC